MAWTLLQPCTALAHLCGSVCRCLRCAACTVKPRHPAQLPAAQSEDEHQGCRGATARSQRSCGSRTRHGTPEPLRHSQPGTQLPLLRPAPARGLCARYQPQSCRCSDMQLTLRLRLTHLVCPPECSLGHLVIPSRGPRHYISVLHEVPRLAAAVWSCLYTGLPKSCRSCSRSGSTADDVVNVEQRLVALVGTALTRACQ